MRSKLSVNSLKVSLIVKQVLTVVLRDIKKALELSLVVVPLGFDCVHVIWSRSRDSGRRGGMEEESGKLLGSGCGEDSGLLERNNRGVSFPGMQPRKPDLRCHGKSPALKASRQYLEKTWRFSILTSNRWVEE